MAGKLKKGDVLLAHVVENADGALPRAGEPDNDASRAAELALQRLHLLGRQMEMLLEEPFKNVHECLSEAAGAASTTIATQGKRTQGAGVLTATGRFAIAGFAG